MEGTRSHQSARTGWLFTFALASLTLVRPFSVNASEEPYVAYIVDDATSLRSGPGDEFYATGALAWGSRVEVYRHDGDFAAVRPPEGSFSWVPALAVTISDDQTTATVIEAPVKTRIGSSTLDRRDAEYVTLENGERLVVLGFQEFEGEEWVKIAPPAGEFRWIDLAQLQKTPPVRIDKPNPADPPDADVEATVDSSVIDDAEAYAVDSPDRDSLEPSSVDESSVLPVAEEPARLSVESQDPDGVEVVPAVAMLTVDPTDESETAANEMQNEASTGWVAVSKSDRNEEVRPTALEAGEGASPDEAVVATTSEEPTTALAQWAYDLSPKGEAPPRPEQAPDSGTYRMASNAPLAVNPELPANPPTAVGTPETPSGFSEVSATTRARALPSTSPEYLDLQLDQLEVEVSREVCKPTVEWQLAEIHGSCMAIIDASGSAEIRERAQALLAKVAQFEDVRRRGMRLAGSVPQQTSVGAIAASPLPAATAAPPTLETPPTALYDGSGWLMPVLTNRRDVPRYVLTDDQGQVLQFVSPQPGMNLNRYERKKVGIFGQRGYLPSMSQPHLMAERVVSLDKVR